MRTDTTLARDAAEVSAAMEAGDFFGWNPVAVVEKFSQDQVDFATRKLEQLANGIYVPDGDFLREVCGEPEDGYAEAVGNLLTTAGLGRLTSLLIAGGGQGLTNTATRLGVGNSSTAAAVGQTDLQAAAGAGNRQFKVMDATYPQQSAGVVTAKSTFATGEANFAWAEWGLDIGTPTVADGTTVAALLLNRKVESLGTKVSGAWALTVTITFS